MREETSAFWAVWGCLLVVCGCFLVDCSVEKTRWFVAVCWWFVVICLWFCVPLLVVCGGLWSFVVVACFSNYGHLFVNCFVKICFLAQLIYVEYSLDLSGSPRFLELCLQYHLIQFPVFQPFFYDILSKF